MKIYLLMILIIQGEDYYNSKMKNIAKQSHSRMADFIAKEDNN